MVPADRKKSGQVTLLFIGKRTQICQILLIPSDQHDIMIRVKEEFVICQIVKFYSLCINIPQEDL